MDERTDVDGTLLRKAKARELMGLACDMVLLAADYGRCMLAVAEAIETAANALTYGEQTITDRRILCDTAAWCRQVAPSDHTGLPAEYWLKRAAIYEKAAVILSEDEPEKLAA